MTLSPLVHEELEVRVAVARDPARIGVIYTSGLQRYGFPELAIEPPPGADPPPELDWPDATVFFGQALLELAECVIDHDTVGVRPLVKYLGAEGVRFRVRSEHETAGAVVALLSGDRPGGGEVRGVTCSWWSP